MQLRVRLDRHLRNVCLIFRVLRLVAEALALHPPPGCACTLCLPLQLVFLDLCLFMPDPRLLDPVGLFFTDSRSDAAVVGSGNKAMGTSPLLTFRSWCRTWGSITKRLHLRLGKKAMEKLMKPVEATLEGRGVR